MTALLTFFSALLIVAAFPPWNLGFLIWIALIPWFAALEKASSGRRAFAQGVGLSFFMSLGGFFWVAYVLRQFGGIPWPIAILGLLLYSLAGQGQFLVFAPLYRWMRTRFSGLHPLFFALLISLTYTGIDWLVPKLFVDTLGHATIGFTRTRQIADLGGASLLTFLVFFTNFALWEVLKSWLNDRTKFSLRQTAPQWGAALALCALAWGYGAYRYAEVTRLTENAPRKVNAAMIQGNIGDFDKVAAEKGVRGAAESVLNIYLELTDQALNTPNAADRPDFIVWPETAYPSTFRTPNTTDELYRDTKVETFVRNRGVPLFFGGYDHAQNLDYNAFFLLTPEPMQAGLTPASMFFGQDGKKARTPFKSSDLQVYQKNILLLFGEYIPFMDSFPAFKKMFPQIANFGRGIGPDVLSIPIGKGQTSTELKTGPIICYEGLFSDYVLGAARQGSQLILNITNDSWFGPFGEPQLHLALTAFRSIETRLPLLRSTNTGISALVLPNGDMPIASSIGTREAIPVKIPVTEPIPTLLKAWGDWFGRFALACAMILAAVARKRSPLQS